MHFKTALLALAAAAAFLGAAVVGVPSTSDKKFGAYNPDTRESSR